MRTFSQKHVCPCCGIPCPLSAGILPPAQTLFASQSIWTQKGLFEPAMGTQPQVLILFVDGDVPFYWCGFQAVSPRRGNRFTWTDPEKDTNNRSEKNTLTADTSHQHIATLDWEIEWIILGLSHVLSLLSTNNDNRLYWCFKITWRESGANGAGWWAVTSLYWDWRRLRLNCVNVKQIDDAYWLCP